MLIFGTAYVIVLTFLGPEYLGRTFNVQHDVDMAVAVHDEGLIQHVLHDSGSNGKGGVQTVETT
jgi:MFS transporter, SHS family, lactate transporter